MILQLVTDRARLCAACDSTADVERCLLLQIEHAVDAEVDMVQVRERTLETNALAGIVMKAVSLSAGTATRILVNDRLDVAIAAGAAGVHLPADSIPGAAAREIAPAGFAIGRSVHSVEEAVAAEPACDYLVAGTVWTSASKPGESRLLGPGGLGAIAKAVHVPVLAIGGVSLDRLPLVASNGAAGIAAIDLFLGPDRREDTRCRAVRLRELVKEARQRFDTAKRPS